MKKISVNEPKFNYTLLRSKIDAWNLDASQPRVWVAIVELFHGFKGLKIKVEEPLDQSERDPEADVTDLDSYKILISRKLTRTESAELRGYVNGLRRADFDVR